MEPNSKNPPAPTETRPPQACKHEGGRTIYLKLFWCSDCGKQLSCTPQTCNWGCKSHSWDKNAETPARAAALEEPPPQLPIGQTAAPTYADMGVKVCAECQGTGFVRLAAPTREPAPRPQWKCPVCQNDGSPCANCMAHSLDGNDFMSRAASSPVVRPQTRHTKAVTNGITGQCVQGCEGCEIDAAARTEQPTLAEQAERIRIDFMRSTPAAPVAVVPAQDFALIAAEKIFALFKNASYFSTRNAEHRKQMVEGWAEIIRTEAQIPVTPDALRQEALQILENLPAKKEIHEAHEILAKMGTDTDVAKEK